jgi:transposase
MRQSYRPAIPPPQPYRTQVLDYLGLVAGMFEQLGITEVIDQATQQDPAMRIVTAGHAVKAMVLNGLGFLNQQLYLVPHFFQHKPLSRLIAPGIQACHLNDDTLGRTLDTLYSYGVTELYSLIAAWTKASYRPKRYSTDTKGKPRQSAGFASSKTRNFGPLLCISKSPSASWPYSW